jgi:LmbE family N-acetylglucosaminyl deacetylase
VSSGSPVLVVVAHPDDEALGFAGVIARSRAEGKRVVVAVVTNGDFQGRGRLPLRYAQAPRGWPARVAYLGLTRNRETVAAMSLLGLRWALDAAASDILFLGYPNGSLTAIEASSEPWSGDFAQLHHTYALERGVFRHGGDFRFLVSGRHSRLCAEDLAADIATLLELVQPAEVYTHAEFDGHPDHAETFRLVRRALNELSLPAMLRTTLIHPEGTMSRMPESANEWPNPSAAAVATPFDRFTPLLEFEPPPVAGGFEWGPLGQPDELVDVPREMLDPDPRRNLKWQVIARHRSQIVCKPDRSGAYHPSCGYMRAFVKRHEFFWRYHG